MNYTRTDAGLRTTRRPRSVRRRSTRSSSVSVSRVNIETVRKIICGSFRSRVFWLGRNAPDIAATKFRRFISSLEQYRGRGQVSTIRLLSESVLADDGNPVASVSQVDYSPSLPTTEGRQDFTLSLGLRYENQTNLKAT